MSTFDTLLRRRGRSWNFKASGDYDRILAETFEGDPT
jgi:hypothetical protein